MTLPANMPCLIFTSGDMMCRRKVWFTRLLELRAAVMCRELRCCGSNQLRIQNE
jgi:hypothetical protein